MAVIGGYNILDLRNRGQIPIPSSIEVTNDEMENFENFDKPTMFNVRFIVTGSSLTGEHSGFAPKILMGGVKTAVIAGSIVISKTGPNTLNFAND